MTGNACRHIGSKRIGGCCGSVLASTPMWICRLLKQPDGSPASCIKTLSELNAAVAGIPENGLPEYLKQIKCCENCQSFS